MSPPAQDGKSVTPGRQARRVHAGQDAADLIDHMVNDLGLWRGKVQAAMFLAAHAVDQGLGPVPEDEIEGHEDVGNLQSLRAGVDDVGELVLFQVASDDDRSLDQVLLDDLKGLIEAGARDLEESLRDMDPVKALAGRLW